MSVRIMAEVWKHSRASGADLLVMLALADFSNDQGESYPSLRILAQKTRLSVRGVCKILDRIQAAGEVRRDRSRGGRNRRTRYFVHLLNSEQHSVNGIQRTAFSEPGDTQTVNGGSHALNRHRTVNKNSASRKRREPADTDPRIKFLLVAFCEKYLARVGAAYVIVAGKDPALLKRPLAAGHQPAAIETAMDRYFADPYHGRIGFDVGLFVKFYSRLNSAGSKKKHDYEKDAFPAL